MKSKDRFIQNLFNENDAQSKLLLTTLFEVFPELAKSYPSYKKLKQKVENYIYDLDDTQFNKLLNAILNRLKV